MAKQVRDKNRDRKIGSHQVEKKSWMHPKHRSTIWTIAIILILLIFFIVNNTRKEPEEGPFPPNFKQNSNNINSN